MNTTADNTAAAMQYLNLAVTHINNNRTTAQAAKGIAKQAGYAVGGTVICGVVFGPLGAAAGSALGALVGYAASDKYDGVLQHVMKMSTQQKKELVQQIWDSVGAHHIESFYNWYKEPCNQDIVNILIVAAAGIAYTTNSSGRS